MVHDITNVSMKHIYKVIYYIIFQFTLRPLTLDDLENKGHRTFNRLYLIKGTFYDQGLYESHVVSHIWPCSLPYAI